MNINKFIQKLIPRHDNFFNLFEEDVKNLAHGGRTLYEAFNFPLSDENRKKLKLIEDIEHKGDMLTHRIFNEMGTSFVTPFDREDIHHLAASIDDVLDHINGVSKRVILYEINSFPVEGLQIIETLKDSISELEKIIPMLRNMDNKKTILEGCVHMNSFENKADDLFEISVANLFKTCTNPIELIKLKEILVGLEGATDKCEDAANAIESIVIKNT